MTLVEPALTGDAALAEAAGCDVAVGRATFAGALEVTRDALLANPASVEWGPRLFMSEDPPRIVGWGGFKGPPANGVVECGYEIAESLRGRGLATAAVRHERDEAVWRFVRHRSAVGCAVSGERAWRSECSPQPDAVRRGEQ